MKRFGRQGASYAPMQDTVLVCRLCECFWWGMRVYRPVELACPECFWNAGLASEVEGTAQKHFWTAQPPFFEGIIEHEVPVMDP